jgi:hypothetical protein
MDGLVWLSGTKATFYLAQDARCRCLDTKQRRTMEWALCPFFICEFCNSLLNSAAMDGRHLIFAIKDDRKSKPCGHGWTLFDSRNQG